MLDGDRAAHAAWVDLGHDPNMTKLAGVTLAALAARRETAGTMRGRAQTRDTALSLQDVTGSLPCCPARSRGGRRETEGH